MSLPFGLSTVLRPLSPSIARTRLKSNLFALVLFTLVSRGWFAPYSSIKKGLVGLGDSLQGRRGREISWLDSILYFVETVILIVLIWNSLEAYIALRYPTSTLAQNNRSSTGGLIMTPSRISSPLTRAYSPSPSKPPSQPQQPLSQSLYRPSPSAAQTPTRHSALPLNASTSSNSPLSSSTAKIFNLPSTPSSASPVKSTGLFFHQPQPQSESTATATATAGGSATADGFVLVDREDKEWIDNVRKGVRGKGARGL